ncbi:alpha/beta hydrolase [Mucilaginibacter sp. CAU 1740]|uniref:alpha/beta fold hydrolase n=1 Tax=Mucilaginibacter sp. CAU 1740 TaxID=3140365 RepID=UPI00325A8952
MSLNRRKFIASTAFSLAAGALGSTVLTAAKSEEKNKYSAGSKTTNLLADLGPLKQIKAGVLNVGYHESGPSDGQPVILMHGFPFDVHAYSQVAPILAAQGCRIIVPYLRGFGPTRFLQAETIRSGQQGALVTDLRNLMDALSIPTAILGGYDWGGRAAAGVALIWPERCSGLVSVNGYAILDLPHFNIPASPKQEQSIWFMYYFLSQRGEAGYRKNRLEINKMLWQTFSPKWAFDDTTFNLTAAAFNNPDHVDVVIHSYRHRYGITQGDPAYAAIESVFAKQLPITVPIITLDGQDDGVRPPNDGTAYADKFTGPRTHRIIPGSGHNLPQEKPQAFADAVMELIKNKK